MRELFAGIFMPRGLVVSQCFFIQNGNTFDMIDTGILFERNTINFQIKLFQKRPRRIFLTHTHADHAGNATYFSKRYSTEIFCHREELPYLFHLRSMNRDYSGGPFLTQVIEVFDKLLGHPKIKDLKIYEEDILSEGDYQFIPMKGHTPGSTSILHKKSRSLFLGDVLLNCHVITYPAEVGLQLPFECFADNYPQALESLQELENIDFENAFFGHGPAIIGGAKKKIMAFLSEKRVISRD